MSCSPPVPHPGLWLQWKSHHTGRGCSGKCLYRLWHTSQDHHKIRQNSNTIQRCCNSTSERVTASIQPSESWPVTCSSLGLWESSTKVTDHQYYLCTVDLVQGIHVTIATGIGIWSDVSSSPIDPSWHINRCVKKQLIDVYPWNVIGLTCGWI